MENQYEFMSKNAYSKYLGVSETAIRKAIIDGKIKNGWDNTKGKIIKELADDEYGFFHLSKSKARPANRKPQKQSNANSVGHFKNKQLGPAVGQPIIERLVSVSTVDDLANLETSDLLKLLPIRADMSFKEASTANEIIEAALKKKKLEEIETVLVRRDLVEKILYASGSNLKKALMMMPARIADELLSAGNKVDVMNIITTEINSILEEYANLGEIDLAARSVS